MNRLIPKAAKSTARVLLVFLWAGALIAQSRPVVPGLTAHEWGTFTSVVGSDGQAVEWTPVGLGDLSFDDKSGTVDSHYWPKELPSFVETLHWGVFKQGLPATIRMETPVLYFYSTQQVTVSVQVRSSKGLITEWYPHAVVPASGDGRDDAALYRKHAADGTISWNNVVLQPGLTAVLPRDSADNGNHYYAARETLPPPFACMALPGTRLRNSSSTAACRRSLFPFRRGSLTRATCSSGIHSKRLFPTSSGSSAVETG
jgi:hypothetical protein